LAFKLNLETVKVNQHAKYLNQRSSNSEVITNIHTGWTNCSVWTTSNKQKSSYVKWV